MSTELKLFASDNLTFKDRFYLLMNILISNQTNSRLDSMLFLGIFFLQIITGFFSEQVGVFDTKKSKSDKILNYLYQILRLKELFVGSYSTYKYCIYIILGVVVVFTLYFIYVITKTSKLSFYTTSEELLNFYTKTYIYIGFNIILDLTISNLCFENDDKNPNWPEASCKISEILGVFIASLILVIFSILFVIFIQFFYCDSLYLSTSFYAKISCNYEIYTSVNGIIYSVLLTLVKYVSKEFFLIYNLIASIFFLQFFINRYLFYDNITNNTAGMFHTLYVWTSLFSLMFAYINVNEKGIIYLASSAIVLYFYFNMKFKVEENILLTTPFYQIKNQYYILYYIKNLIDKINHFEESPEEKALLTGIMQMHAIECPNPTCVSKLKTEIYLPLTNEWSDRTKPLITDKVYLMNFIILVMNFFIGHNYYSPNMVINMSLYFLEIIGNFCQAMFYYKKVKEMKLSLQEYFSFIRLELKISQALVEKLKAENEACYSLEDLNVTMYFKYEDLSKSFFDEMNNDVNLSLDFWKTFKNCQTDQNQSIDFNKIFHLTDKIRITKNKVQQYWSKLIKIFNGVNDLFELYLQYVEQINDDDLLKRDLEEIKRKNENSTEHIQLNFYSVLFSKDTGIIIANGDKGKEGIIKKANSEVEAIFKYKPEELKGMNLSNLMPRLFAKNHKNFVEKYYDIGEKKVIDKKDFRTFGKDKNNSILMLKMAKKIFPMLNECVYFVALISKENIDDIIFIDSKFNIQGMSTKLMKILQIENKMLFQDNDIPFYVICKKFVNFYKIFLQGKKQNAVREIKDSNNITNDTQNDITSNGEGDQNSLDKDNENSNTKDNKDIHENVEINENIELEYEIRLPKFLIEYSNTTAQREQRTNNKLFKSNSEINNDNNQTGSGELVDDDLIQEEYEENALLSETPDKPRPTTKGTSKQVLKQSNLGQTKITDDGKDSDIGFNKPDEEKEFITKIAKFKDLFKNAKFNDLEDFYDKCVSNSQGQEFKFNFTFDRYKYGDHQMAFVIRCIDNKNEGGKCDDDTNGDPNAMMKGSKYKLEKAEAIKHLVEVYEEEKNQIIEQQEKYIQLSLENKQFQQLLNQCKEDINKMSIVHGQKKETIIEDENSSQSSSTGFNADLCKKNRIEEIRANIMNNVNHFYTLKYIKFLVLSVGAITCVFCALYLVFFTWLYNDLIEVSKLNSAMFRTTFWISNIVSTLISLKTIYNFDYHNESYEYKSYIDSHQEYFEELRQKGIKWYNETISTFGYLENNIEDYIKKNDLSFWGSQNVSYNYEGVNDTEGFPLSLEQVLSDINSLLKNEKFRLSSGDIDKKASNYLDYIMYLSIENSYDNLIPKQFEKLLLIPTIFQDFNKNNIHILLYSLIIYCCVMVIFCVIYNLFLYTTNKNMGEGLLKVTKIRLEKIDDTLKRIEGFNALLKRYRDKDNNKSSQDDEEVKNDIIAPTTPDKTTEQKTIFDQSISSSSLSSAGFNENKNHKQLTILSYSYYQTSLMIVLLCAMLIPMYVITYGMVKNTNKLIDVQDYLFGKLIQSSASTVKVKCMMSQCSINNELVYDILVNSSDLQSIVQGITTFPELSDFYSNKYLSNACEAAYDNEREPEQYEKCMNDVLVKSANNSDSLLKLVSETIDDIYKEADMMKGTEVEFANGTTGEYTTLLLYNSSSFLDIENVFYNFITPLSPRLNEVFDRGLKKYLDNKKVVVIILICLFGVLIFTICGFIGFVFVKTLVHLLSVSRCVFRIIPTTVIGNTPDLVTWIENIY